MPTKKTKTSRRRDREVLEAATKVFHERGYADATVQDVADELGILKGSLYHYIRTKEDLLFWLLEEVHEHVEVILGEVAAEEDLPPLEKLELYVRRQVEYAVGDLPRISIYYHDVDQLSGPRLKDIVRRRKTHETWVREQITAAQERGEVNAELDPALLTNCLFGTMIWVYRWYRPNGNARRDAVVDHVTRFALAGVIGAGTVAPLSV
jgi:TetR/AcrR family transcriptional regulator, cholesterol catabolism regulator